MELVISGLLAAAIAATVAKLIGRSKAPAYIKVRK